MEKLNWEFMIKVLPLYREALWLTLRLGLCGTALASAVGLLCAAIQYEKVPVLQQESALSLGLTRGQTMRYVILPQAMSISMPAFMANVIFLLKETSVFSAVSLMDLMFTAKDLIAMYAKTTEALALLVVCYLLILLPVSLLGSWLERRLRYA